MDAPPAADLLYTHQSEQINDIAEALSKAQGQFEMARKESQNPHLGNKYASLSAVLKTVQKPLSENGLAVVQMLGLAATGEQVLITKLIHRSGQWFQSVAGITTLPGKGLNDMQAFGSGLSYLRRYSVKAILGLDETDDDAHQFGDLSKPRNQTPKSDPKAAPASPSDPSAATSTRKPGQTGTIGKTISGVQDLPKISGVEYRQKDGRVLALGDNLLKKKKMLEAAGFRRDSRQGHWYIELAA
ncbi:MAG: ERF family protein [Desulfobacteraceae bacterium]|nr:ERF family protein [Desulfobacteraceae bacterium]